MRFLVPGAPLYFVVLLILSGVAALMGQYVLAGVELAVTAVMLVLFRISTARKKKEILRYIQSTTASLDTETEKLIQEALGRLTQNRTTFAIAHRLSTLQHADRLVVLDKGRIAEIGTHMELLRNKSVYYNLVMAQRQTSRLSKE